MSDQIYRKTLKGKDINGCVKKLLRKAQRSKRFKFEKETEYQKSFIQGNKILENRCRGRSGNRKKVYLTLDGNFAAKAGFQKSHS